MISLLLRGVSELDRNKLLVNVTLESDSPQWPLNVCPHAMHIASWVFLISVKDLNGGSRHAPDRC